MPIEKLAQFGQDYYLLSFDKKGVENGGDPDAANGSFAQRILEDAAAVKPSHIFFYSHGWKGDMPAARQQYQDWIGAMLRLEADKARFGAGFRPMYVGLHWPSLPFGDENLEGSFAVEGGVGPEAMVAEALDKLDLEAGGSEAVRTIIRAHWEDAAATELSPEVVAAYEEVARKAGYVGGDLDSGAERAPDEEGGEFRVEESFQAANDADAAADFGGGGLLGGVLGPMRQLSYWTMKKRARSIGESGMHDFVGRLMQALPGTRFHLMGHSFGCIVMSSILAGKDGKVALPRPVDSAVLVQGAVSLWSWAEKLPKGAGTGYFYPVLQRKGVKGPLVVTQSVHDRAVGYLYPLASAMGFAGAEFNLGDFPKIGAIGKYGAQGSGVGEDRPMLEANGEYGFQGGRVYNLDANQYIDEGGGLSGAHSDISGPEVAHAIWQAAEAGGKV